MFYCTVQLIQISCWLYVRTVLYVLVNSGCSYYIIYVGNVIVCSESWCVWLCQHWHRMSRRFDILWIWRALPCFPPLLSPRLLCVGVHSELFWWISHVNTDIVQLVSISRFPWFFGHLLRWEKATALRAERRGDHKRRAPELTPYVHYVRRVSTIVHSTRVRWECAVIVAPWSCQSKSKL